MDPEELAISHQQYPEVASSGDDATSARPQSRRNPVKRVPRFELTRAVRARCERPFHDHAEPDLPPQRVPRLVLDRVLALALALHERALALLPVLLGCRRLSGRVQAVGLQFFFVCFFFCCCSMMNSRRFCVALPSIFRSPASCAPTLCRFLPRSAASAWSATRAATPSASSKVSLTWARSACSAGTMTSRTSTSTSVPPRGKRCEAFSGSPRLGIAARYRAAALMWLGSGTVTFDARAQCTASPCNRHSLR